MPILIAVGSAILLAAVFGPSWWIKHVLKKHGVDRPDLPGTGGEFARHLLDEAKLTDVKVETTDQGDHYDPTDRAVRLLPQHHDKRSVAAVAIAAHEVSHAIQHARAEPAFMRRIDASLTTFGGAATSLRTGICAERPAASSASTAFDRT